MSCKRIFGREGPLIPSFGQPHYLKRQQPKKLFIVIFSWPIYHLVIITKELARFNDPIIMGQLYETTKRACVETIDREGLQRNRESDNKWYLLGGFWLPAGGRQSLGAWGEGGTIIASLSSEGAPRVLTGWSLISTLFYYCCCSCSNIRATSKNEYCRRGGLNQNPILCHS